MLKTIALLVLSSALVTLLLTSCSKQTSDELTTDENERIIAAIDKSTPLSEGNLITKTETDSDGNLNINYYDSDGNLVENFVWTDYDKNISHTVLKYSDDNLLVEKEEISPDGSTDSVESYRYDSENNLTQKTFSEILNGKTTKSTVFDAQDNILGSTAFAFNAADRLSKVEKFDKNNNLVEYLVYEYNEKNQNTKCSTFGSDEKLIRYSCFEYNSSGLVTKEQNFDGNHNLIDYYETEYSADGTMTASRHFDSQGVLLSEDIM